VNGKTTTLICGNPFLPSFNDKAFDLNSEYFCLPGSQGCSVYDVVINDEFFQKCQVCVLYVHILKVPQEYCNCYPAARSGLPLHNCHHRMLVSNRKIPYSSSFLLQFLWRDWKTNTTLS